MPANNSTKRVFIAATRMNDGKTTVALGLFAALKRHYRRIGFIKPVGQRFVDVEGAKIDEDSVLMGRTHQIDVPIQDMSPIAVEPDFTRKYIAGKASSDALVKRIEKAFDRCAWERDFVVIEGTGHAGVGSVFDLSNARVAKILDARVILVTLGGIGRPIDEVALNKALFDRMGVEVIGVIVNKALPEKLEMVADFCRRGFKRLDIELLGVIPNQKSLTQPTLDQVCELLKGTFLNGEGRKHTRVSRTIVGAMLPQNLLAEMGDGVLIITPGDREDILLSVLELFQSVDHRRKQVSGVVLTRDIAPSKRVTELIQRSEVPVILAAEGTFAVASKVHDMTIKTTATDCDKIRLIEDIFDKHVDVTRILDRV